MALSLCHSGSEVILHSVCVCETCGPVAVLAAVGQSFSSEMSRRQNGNGAFLSQDSDQDLFVTWQSLWVF